MSRLLRLLPVVLILIVAGHIAATADPIGDAVKAKKRGDYARAHRILRPLAEKGDPRAQHELGFAYEFGETPSKLHRTEQLKLARKWYERSAAQNYTPGKRALGNYMVGHGIDAMRGYRILLALAEAGDAGSQALLGYHMAERANIRAPERLRIPGTADEGLAWLHKSVDQKYQIAAFLLRQYHLQYGSHAKAYFWKLVLGGLSKQRPMGQPPVTDRFTKKQRADIERRAAAWLTARGVKPMHGVEKR